MIFSRIFKTALMAVTLFIVSGFISTPLLSVNDAQAKQYTSKKASAKKAERKKYRHSRKRNLRNKKNLRRKKVTRSSHKKRYARRNKAKDRKIVRRNKMSRRKGKRRRVVSRKMSRRKAKRLRRHNNKTKYRISAGKRNKRLRHSIFKQSFKPGSIIVSFGDRKLYYFSSGKRVIVYPIGTPRKGFEWKGKTHVSWKTVNPRWTPTKRMREENPKLPEYVEGGTKANPLGVRALYLGKSQYRIHGTNVPWSIGQARSSGCIRMHNSHVIDLYNRVKPKAPVLITWTKYAKRPPQYANTRFKKRRAKKHLRNKKRLRNRRLRKRATSKRNKKTRKRRS